MICHVANPSRNHFDSFSNASRKRSNGRRCGVGPKDCRRIWDEYQRRIFGAVMWLLPMSQGLDAIVGVLNTTCGKDFPGCL